MGSTILELTRATHEDLEQAQRYIIEELDYAPRNFKESVIQSNKINKYLEKVQESKDKLIQLYEDPDGSRKEEISSMAGAGPNLFSNFYEKLRELKDYHRRFPGLDPESSEATTYIEDADALPPFTGEEGYGKALDLHEYYERFINLKEIKSIASDPQNRFYKLLYIDYVQNIFFKFNDAVGRNDNEYKKYIHDLLDYLISFIQRSQPLFDFDPVLKEIDQEFSEKWQNGQFKWNTEENSLNSNNGHSNGNGGEDGDSENKKNNKRKNQESGPEPGPNSNSLYCVYCKKQFAKETVFNAHLTGKKHIQLKEKSEKKNGASSENSKEIYQTEWKIHELAMRLLQEQIHNTKLNIEKKQARSADELLMDEEEEEEVYDEGEESEDEPEIKMTIDNYPIGWDGKPIPYWLYKLHGLGVEYNCEICGNSSYFGRKAYEKHFQEWRHAHGMRCLGIPNSRHFHDITSIKDAIALWEKIRKDATTQVWKADAEEEYEDKEGNVYNRKTFEDLKRQGLI